MTAQRHELLGYQGKKYSILAIENEFPFSPQDYGFNPVMLHTGCYRGYYSLFAVKENELLLDKLFVNQEEELPVWRGVEPVTGEDVKWTYAGLDLPIDYTGGIIVGDGFLHKYYQHMGYQYPHCYEEVLEFKFTGGELEDVIDKSDEAEAAREVLEEEERSQKEITRYIRDTFSLSYRQKGV